MKNEISKNLAYFRRKRNMTQKELAQRTGLSISFISHIENKISEPSDENLKKIAEVLEVSPSDLQQNEDLKTIRDENLELIKLLIKLTLEEKIEWENMSDETSYYDVYTYSQNESLTYSLEFKTNYQNQIDNIYLTITDEDNFSTTTINVDTKDDYNYLFELLEAIKSIERDKSPIFKYLRDLEELDKD